MGYTGFSGENITQNATIGWYSSPGASRPFYTIELEATANYQSGSTTLAVPDLSGVDGLLAPPSSGTQVEWSAGVEQQSYGLGSQAPLNATWSSVWNDGSYAVP
jgi:hypothetical protein